MPRTTVTSASTAVEIAIVNWPLSVSLGSPSAAEGSLATIVTVGPASSSIIVTMSEPEAPIANKSSLAFSAPSKFN